MRDRFSGNQAKYIEILAVLRSYHTGNLQISVLVELIANACGVEHRVRINALAKQTTSI